MHYFLYILQSESKQTYYTGASDDPERRCFFHNNASKGYTQRYRPWKIVYSHRFDSKKQALAAERKVKSWKSNKMIRLLVQSKININDYT
jgi:putative endonuclease